MAFSRRKPLLLATALAGVLAAIVAPPSRAETLTDTLITAYQTSPLLESSRAALRAVDENVPQARSARRPQLSGAGSALATKSTRVPGETGSVFNADLQATLLLYDNGETKAAIESALMSVASARADLRDVEQTVLFNAVQAYMDVLRDLEILRIARSDLNVLGEELRAAQNRFDVGEVTRTDVSLTEARLAQSRAALALAEGNLQLSRQAYLAAVGTPPEDLSPAPPVPELPATPEAAIALALERNPNINAAQFAVRAAAADYARARAADGLRLDATASIGYDGSDGVLGRGDDLVGTAGVQASVPLYTGGLNSSLVRQAQQIVERRQAEVQEAGRFVTQAVRNAWIQLEVSQASIVANERQLEAATIAYEGVSEEARLGARSTIDVLASAQDRLEAEANLIQARRDAYVAAYALLQAIGLLTVDHLGLGIETYDPDTNFVQVQSAPMGGYDTSAVDRIRARWQK